MCNFPKFVSAFLLPCCLVFTASCYSDESSSLQDDEHVLIGIAWRADTESALYTNVVQAIEEAGGTPVLLPQAMPEGWQYEKGSLVRRYADEHGILEQTYADDVKLMETMNAQWAQAVGKVDAVVFTGGEDIAPTLQRNPEPTHAVEAAVHYNATRDVSDYLTMTYCLRQNMPILGMCRGMQMLAVVSGATIIQDVPSAFDPQGQADQHTVAHHAYSPCDVVVTTRESLLYGTALTRLVKGVPLWLHQCVGSVEGTHLVVTGITERQGTQLIEVVERYDKTFVLGLQYHPEAAVAMHLAGSNDASQFMTYEQALSYFTELVRQARAYKIERLAKRAKDL